MSPDSVSRLLRRSRRRGLGTTLTRGTPCAALLSVTAFAVALATATAPAKAPDAPAPLHRLLLPDLRTDPPESMSVAVNEDDRYWQEVFNSPGFDARVMAFVEYRGELIVAGGFRHAGRERVNRIARWNGESWVSLGGGMNGTVYALAVYDGKLIAAGGFTTAGGLEARNIAGWDGESWGEVGGGIDGTVSSLAVYEGDLIAGGYFSRAGDVLARSLACWNGLAWRSMNLAASHAGHDPSVMTVLPMDGRLAVVYQPTPGEDEVIVWSSHVVAWEDGRWVPYEIPDDPYQMQPTCAAFFQGELIAAGWYSDWYESRTSVARWTGVEWEEIGGEIPSVPSALTVHDGRLHVAFAADHRAGVAGGIAWWDGSDWIVLPGGPRGTIDAFADRAGKLLAGGDFYITGNTSLRGLAEYDGSSWKEIGDLPGLGCNAYVLALAADGDRLFASGAFGRAGTAPVANSAMWNGEAWTNVSQTPGFGPTGDTRTLLIFNGALIATRWESQLYGIDRRDGSAWTRMGAADYSVRTLLVWGDHLIAGGGFTRIDDTPARHVAAYDGRNWLPLGRGFNGPVQSLAGYDGGFVAAGHLEDCDSAEVVRPAVARWSGAEWIPLGDGPGFTPAKMIEHARGLIVSGTVTSGSSGRQRLLRWDGRVWRPFGGEPNGKVADLAIHHGRLIAAGEFTSIGGVSLQHVACWNGESWEPLGSGTSGAIQSLVVRGDDLFLGGSFHSAGGKASQNIAWWSEPAPASVSDLTATREGEAILLYWRNPADGDYRETVIRFSNTDYPTGPLGGRAVANGNDGRFPGVAGAVDRFVDVSSSDGANSYYAAYAVDGEGRYSAAAYACVERPDETQPELSLEILHSVASPETVVVHVRASEPLDRETLFILAGPTRVPAVSAGCSQENWKGFVPLAASADTMRIAACAADPFGNEGCAAQVLLSVSSIQASAGGQISSPDGRLTLVVPPEAFFEDCHLTAVGASNPGDLPAYVIGPRGLAVGGGTLTISYTADDLQGREPDHLALVQDGNVLQSLVDARRRLVSAEIGRLGRFALISADSARSLILDPSFLAVESASPNPFVATTHLRLELRQSQRVRATVHDISGRRIAVIADTIFGAGSWYVSWNGMEDGGRHAPSGLYFVRIETDDQTQVRRVIRVQ